MSDLQKALSETIAHAPFYERARQYHEGERTEQFASTVLARLLKGSANRFRMNYARVPVVALCNRIKISSFGVATSPEATAYLADQWDRNALENLYREVHTIAASSGSAYLMAWPDEEDESESDVRVDVSMSDPTMTRAFYSPDNPRKMLFVSRSWIHDGETKSVRVNLYYADRIEKYLSKPGAKGDNANDFLPWYDLYEDSIDETGGVVSEPVWPIPNPYGRIPVFHFRVGAGYGRPVNRDAWEPQDAINKLTSTMMSTVDYQGAPQRYALEHPDKAPEDADLDSWEGDEDDKDSGVAGRGNESLKAGPGGMWFLNAQSVGQFSPADSKAFLEPMGQYIKAISTTTETPMHAFHGMGDAPSGESLRAANAPLNDNAVNTEGWFEPTWLDFFRFLLEVGGYADSKPTMLWANPERADDQEFWDSVKTKIEAGVPLRKALQDAGYTEEQIQAWYPGTTVARSNAELAALADVIQKLSAASALGLLSVEEIRLLLPQDILIKAEGPTVEDALRAVADVVGAGV